MAKNIVLSTEEGMVVMESVHHHYWQPTTAFWDQRYENGCAARSLVVVLVCSGEYGCLESKVVRYPENGGQPVTR